MADTNTTPDKELDALYESVLNCEPAIPPEEVEPLANLVMNQERVGRQWRLTALIAGKDGAFFSDIANNAAAAQAFAHCVDALHDFSSLLRTMADLSDCAAARISTAGCNHEDFIKWMAEEA
ncbi:MAG: hypothetical protein OJJ21_04910 [Ferrovibrio sp.]|uniref:hypothetical protein n=1 Tax=Ferrovibrio sp. TaxID=1917215 RepID=UPI0026111243|nr:hypothetical protein [Ferrovibrio sp.]MCW0232920.1 hypothetical protein [Ferrovibrio sp.]